MAHVPGNARQLRCAIGDTGGEASNGRGHGVNRRCKGA
jgi:hypothetical protein